MKSKKKTQQKRKEKTEYDVSDEHFTKEEYLDEISNNLEGKNNTCYKE
jgi:hypothetical protein